ncbi:CoA transferase [Salicibibacter cibi]|uniref:CoA transferase n=1 Tax=Salicibibacter cibi TaxID=2743001 RepID=A0A7T7CFP6_9BACI|nr:CoA transferase [Salicibibacter cibi]QQK80298.1 CoA transferase [Salicibibacter cibi]
MGVLDGIRILDLTRLLPGPYCTMLMGDYGAEVIKVEQPVIGDYGRNTDPFIEGYSTRHLVLNRNKKSVTLDLKSEEGKEIFKNLAKDADVIIEGFRPGVMNKLGLSYEQISALNPGIIYCSITGYGQDGPYNQLAGHDINYIGYSGVLGLIGEKNGQPIVPGVQIADIGGGSLMSLAGVLMALLHKERTGQGQYVDISMMDGVLSWLSGVAGGYLAAGDKPKRGETRLSGQKACYGVYETKDGKYLSVGALEEKFWKRLCQLLEKEDFIDRLSAPEEEQQEMKQELQRIFLEKNQQEWLNLLKEDETCVGPVHDIDEVFADPQVIAREMMIESEHPALGMLKQIGFPIKFSTEKGDIRRNAPDLGEHNHELFGELGYSPAGIQQLQQQRII